MIDATPLGPLLDRPVHEVLAGLGLPPLPVLPSLPPLPELPPLPAIDLSMLFKPITDLLGGFGTGDLSTAGFDPSVVFEGLADVLETSLSMSQGALAALDQLWMGQAAMSAATKTTEASANSAALSIQSGGISVDIQAAAGIVAAGLAAVQAILVATIGKITVIGPGLLTPPGQGAALFFATEGLSEATAAVAVTRAQLLGPTTAMTVNGAPVSVTNAPTPVHASTAQSPFAIASSILETLAPVLSTVTELSSRLSAPVAKMLSVHDKPDASADLRCISDIPDADDPAGPAPDGTTTSAITAPAGFGGVAAVSGIGSVMAPLAPARSSMPLGATEPAAFGPSSRTAAAVSAATSAVPASIAPMAGAAGAARGAGTAGEHHETPDFLVTEDNGQVVVGAAFEVAPPVLGDEHIPAALAPDIELRLGAPRPDITA
ncbi:MAG: hypothetical protein QM673_07675 [Gordonia sp. (in: high G+C Gram-positive bacteria)]